MALLLSQSDAQVGIEAALGALPTDAQQLFQQMFAVDFFLRLRQQEQLRLDSLQEQLRRDNLVDNTPKEPKKSKRKQRKKTLRQNSRVYNDGVVLWLMIAQRLKGGGTMEDAVLELLHGLPKSFWPKPCKRLRPTPEGEKPMRFQVLAPLPFRQPRIVQ